MTVPSEKVLMRRFKAINDDSHLVEKLYPKLTARAGEDLNTSGIELTIALAVHNYTQDLQASGPLAATISMLISKLTPQLTAAMVNSIELLAGEYAAESGLAEVGSAGQGVTFWEPGGLDEFIPFTDLGYSKEIGFFRLSRFPEFKDMAGVA